MNLLMRDIFKTTGIAMFPQGSSSLKHKPATKHMLMQGSSSLKNKPAFSKWPLWFPCYQPLKPWLCLTVTSILLADHTLPLDCLPFGRTVVTSDLVSHPLHTAMFWEVPNLPRTSCYQKTSLVPKKQVSFKIFLDLLNMKILPSY